MMGQQGTLPAVMVNTFHGKFPESQELEDSLNGYHEILQDIQHRFRGCIIFLHHPAMHTQLH